MSNSPSNVRMCVKHHAHQGRARTRDSTWFNIFKMFSPRRLCTYGKDGRFIRMAAWRPKNIGWKECGTMLGNPFLGCATHFTLMESDSTAHLIHAVTRASQPMDKWVLYLFQTSLAPIGPPRGDGRLTFGWEESAELWFDSRCMP